MKTIELQQGTPQWHAHRAAHFNASDAPALMGASPYQTRQELLDTYTVGIDETLSATQAKVFANGHRFERLARPLAEDIIGEDLYPITGVEMNSKLSASFDGLTMLEDIAWEHKTLNNRLREIMVDGAKGADLPAMYRIQMQQQLMISGAERCLFTASAWDDADNLVEAHHVWYESDPELAESIRSAWALFEQDLKTHTVTARTIDPLGKSPAALPALNIQVTGAVTASNLDQFKSMAMVIIEGINTQLETDQDFADAEKSVKWCVEVEKRLAATKDAVLAQTTDIDAALKTLDEVSVEARNVRLNLDKLIRARKLEIKAEIIQAAKQALLDMTKELNAEFDTSILPVPTVDFTTAIKGKRNLESIRGAVDAALAEYKIELGNLAKCARVNLKLIEDAPAHLFYDKAQLALKETEFVKAVITNRVADDDARKEAETDGSTSAKAISSLKGQHQTMQPSTLDKPKDTEIVAAIATQFGVSMGLAIEWVKEINLDTLQAA